MRPRGGYLTEVWFIAYHISFIKPDLLPGPLPITLETGKDTPEESGGPANFFRCTIFNRAKQTDEKFHKKYILGQLRRLNDRAVYNYPGAVCTKL